MLKIIIFALFLIQSCAVAKIINLPKNGGEATFKDISHFYVWAKHFKDLDQNVVIAAIGRPTALLYRPLKEAMKEYVNNLDEKEAIEYGDLQEEEYTGRMAKALEKMYKKEFSSENILFTVGGRMGGYLLLIA